jgi:hypothetical protein
MFRALTHTVILPFYRALTHTVIVVQSFQDCDLCPRRGQIIITVCATHGKKTEKLISLQT